ncbi:MAG: chemotaxis protein CheA [Gammaproteobacteria bacterium]|nr:chemotaxis protein CheA [Gammaproteobacteria bacterium]
MTIDMSKFLDTFFEESAEGLDAMESGLLHMQDGAADDELVNTIFRAAHSIKGGSATFGLSEVAEFTHHMETLLDEVRAGKRAVASDLVDVLLESVDCLRAMLAASKSGSAGDPKRAKSLSARMAKILGVATGHVVVTASAQPVQAASGGWRIVFRPHAHLYRTGNDPVRMLRELAELGEYKVSCDTSRLPGFVNAQPEECALSWTVELRGEIPEKRVREVFDWVDGDCDLTLEPLPASSEKLAPDAPAVQAVVPVAKEKTNGDKTSTPAAPAAAETTSIRVGIDKVDALINMVGELVITQSMLGQVGKDFDMSRVEKLMHGLAQLERNTRELQESVMRIRMMPISFAFQRFPRMVRDLSQKLNKKIELRMSGEQTELDKTVMEKIGDPLVHLVRNSVDHGIEMPDVRRAAGKAETGIVTLNAFHQGGNIVIEIKDDGAGLPRGKIIAKARKQGLLGADEEPDDNKVFELIFMAGFSTADQVSDVSGRGVGMDVVRKNIKALGGTVDVKSESGKGSTFTIRLPLTLAILDGQLVSVGEQTYIVPLVSIVETLQMKKEAISAIAGRAELYRLRDEYIPVLRLYGLFGIEPRQKDLANGLLVVVEGEGKRVGLFVDDLQNQQQVVIKSLESNFKRVPGVSGATILGDGTVALILDVSGVIDASRQATAPSGLGKNQAQIRAA